MTKVCIACMVLAALLIAGGVLEIVLGAVVWGIAHIVWNIGNFIWFYFLYKQSKELAA